MKFTLVFFNKVISLLLILGVLCHTWAYTVPIADRKGIWVPLVQDCYLTDLGSGVWKFDFTLVPNQYVKQAFYSTAGSYVNVYGLTYDSPGSVWANNNNKGLIEITSITPSDLVDPPIWHGSGYPANLHFNSAELLDPVNLPSVYKGFFTTLKVSGLLRNDPAQIASGQVYPAVLISTYTYTSPDHSSGVGLFYNWASFTSNGICKSGTDKGPTDPEPQPSLDPKFSLTSPNWSLKPVKLSDLNSADVGTNLLNAHNETLSSEQICIDYDKAAVKSTLKWRLSASSINGKVTRNGKNLFTLLGPTVSSTGLNSKAYYAVELNPTDPNSGMKKQYLPQQTFYTESASDLTLPTSTDGTRNKACWTPTISLFKGAEGSQETGPGLHNDNMLLLITPST